MYLKLPVGHVFCCSLQGALSSFDVSKADVFMLGVLLFYVQSCGHTWKKAVESDVEYSAFIRSKGNLDSLSYAFWEVFSLSSVPLFSKCFTWPPNLKDVISKVLRPEPALRPTVDQILESQWMKDVRNA